MICWASEVLPWLNNARITASVAVRGAVGIRFIAELPFTSLDRLDAVFLSIACGREVSMRLALVEHQWTALGLCLNPGSFDL